MILSLLMWWWLGPAECSAQANEGLEALHPFKHWSWHHLMGNLAAAAIVIVWGWAARLSWRHALAWLIALPAFAVAMAWWPGHACTAGLSGLSYCGIAIGAVKLLQERGALQRIGGVIIAGGLIIKTTLEAFIPESLPELAALDGSMVMLDVHAHIVGIVIGTVAAVLVSSLQWAPPRILWREGPLAQSVRAEDS